MGVSQAGRLFGLMVARSIDTDTPHLENHVTMQRFSKDLAEILANIIDATRLRRTNPLTPTRPQDRVSTVRYNPAVKITKRMRSAHIIVGVLLSVVVSAAQITTK